MELENQLFDESQILSKIGSWSWDLTTNDVIWSKNMFRILGLEPHEFKPTYELAFQHVHDSDKKRYEEILTLATTNKTDYYFENKIVTKDNLVTPVISRGKCILDENQNLIQMIGTVQDVSILKELEKVNLDKNKAEEKNRIKSLVLGVIAHDIFGPLNHIQSFSEIIIENIQSEKFENAFEHACIIKDSSNQVRKVLDNLFDWALTDQNKKLFKPEIIAPNTIIESVIKYLNISLTKKNITINNTIKSGIMIFADKNMLIVIIRNILSNSIKYSNNNGEITIALSQEINGVLISISDEGIGIEAEIMNNIFNTNKLISTEGTDNEMGHGLGLQICKTFVEKHNGKIWFDSKIGRGTICNFTLSQNQRIKTVANKSSYDET